MGKTLIIAEKPSQARAYAKALNVQGRSGEGFIAGDKYIITWCIGHLLELEKPEKYMNLEQSGTRWSLRRLPVLPKVPAFRYALKPSTSKQYQVIEGLLKSSEISDVVCGTDADREGQLLFQEVWDRTNCSKPLLRLWVSSLTDEAILEGMSNLLPASAVAGLTEAGYGRAFADWDFGMNLTEGFTSLFGSFDAVRKKPNVISIGRVQTPTLALVVEREWEIARFVNVNYFEVKAEFQAGSGAYTGTWINQADGATRLTERQQAEGIEARVSGQEATIQKLEEKEVQEAHPLLFDLTSLTVTAAKRWAFGAEQVLSLAQALYEKKAITYPRTDCNYLPPDMVPKLPDHLRAIDQEPYSAWVRQAQASEVPCGKRVINNITAHHAIIPTTEQVVLDRLSADELKIYDLIVRRFLAVWFPPARYHQTEVRTAIAGEIFRTKGKALVFAGWKQVYAIEEERNSVNDSGEPSGGKSKTGRKKNAAAKGKEDGDEELSNLPILQEGQLVNVAKTWIEDKETKPPKRFSQADLLKAMESAGKQIEDEALRQQLKGKGLGTVATRPAIISNLLDRGYLLEEQRVLKPTPKGLELIALIKERLPQAALLVSAEMTGRLEYDLARVERAELSLEEYMTTVESAIRQIIEELRVYERANGKTPLAFAPALLPKSDGKSKPGTKGNTKEGKTATAEKRPRTAKVRSEQQILSNTDGVGEDSASSSARVSSSVPASSSVTEAKLVPESLGQCPRCDGYIIEGKKGYGCANWRQGCSWVVWKNPICEKVLTPSQIKSLLKQGKTPVIKGFRSKNGNVFAAYLVWEDKEAGKLKFEFLERT